MFEIPRTVLRQFRAVCRRAQRGGRTAGGRMATAVIRADSKGMTLAARFDRVWLSYRLSGRFTDGEFTIPLDALAEFDQKGRKNVLFECCMMRMCFGQDRSR